MAFHDAEVLRRLPIGLMFSGRDTRRRDDPLIVDRNRGDPIVRGVQIIIGVKLEEQFADRLDGTGATLASVALGTETSPRVSAVRLKITEVVEKALFKLQRNSVGFADLPPEFGGEAKAKLTSLIPKPLPKAILIRQVISSL